MQLEYLGTLSFLPANIFAQFGLSKMHLTATFQVIYVQQKWLLRKNSRLLCGHVPISRMRRMLQHPQTSPLNPAL